jgi:hypothetical protein
MEVQLFLRKPQAWPSNVVRSYETRYIYTGFGKYDTEQHKLISMRKLENGNFEITEINYDPQIISRGYHTEHVRVDIYSEQPRIWTENLSPYEVYYFQQH